MKRPRGIKLTVAHLRHLWENECKHKEKYMKPTNPLTWNPDDCQDCFLAKIPWRPKLGAMKDLCFLIWRGKILEKKRRRNNRIRRKGIWHHKKCPKEG